MTVMPALWPDQQPSTLSQGRLEGARSVDCVIIGAGLTGVTAALDLQRAGLTTIVLEANTIGSGASCNAGGHLIPSLTSHTPDELTALFRIAGERFAALVRDSATTTFDLLRSENISADAAESGWIELASAREDIRALEQRHAAWHAYRANCEFLSREVVERATGSKQWTGGWHLKTGGSINPRAATLGLAAAAIRHGSTIHDGTPVLSFGRAGTRWVVTAPLGRIDSRAVILASNAYTDAYSARLEPNLAREIVPTLAWQVATAPLPENLRAHIMPALTPAGEMAPSGLTIRRDQQHRLLIGGQMPTPTATDSQVRTAARAELRRIFNEHPAVADVAIEAITSGRIGSTPDRLPRAHQLGPDGYAWLGCNGRGLALAVAAGRELARAVTGTPHADLALPLTEPNPMSFHAIKRYGGLVGALKSRLLRQNG